MVTWRRYTIALLQRSPIDGVLYNAVVAHRYSRVSFSAWVAGARKARAPRPGDARLSAVRPSIFLRRCRLSLSFSLSSARKPLFLHAHGNICLRTISPVERSWKTNKQKGSRLHDLTDTRWTDLYRVAVLRMRFDFFSAYVLVVEQSRGAWWTFMLFARDWIILFHYINEALKVTIFNIRN